jgi:hypothetical protein
MKLTKTKNGFKMVVEKCSNVITITNLTTKEVQTIPFSDHIQAVLALKAI